MGSSIARSRPASSAAGSMTSRYAIASSMLAWRSAKVVALEGAGAGAREAPISRSLTTDDDLTDLEDRLRVGVIRDIRPDLVAVRAHARAVRFDGLAEDVAHGHVSRRGARRA